MPVGLNETPVGFVDPACPLDWSHPLNRGLVGCWSSLPNSGRNGGGLKLRNITGLGNDGALSDFPSPLTATNGWAFGKLGGKGAIIGTSPGATQRVALARAITGLASWSMTVWYKPNVYYFQHSDALAGDYYGHANRPTPTIFGYNSGTGKQKWTATGTVASAAIDYDMDLNTWYFVGVTSDRTTVRFFINGKEVGSSATDIGTMQVYGLYTYDATFGGNPLQGTADIFRLYNRVLPSTQIANLYQEQLRGSPETLRWVGARTYGISSQVAPAGGGTAIFRSGILQSQIIGGGIVG